MLDLGTEVAGESVVLRTGETLIPEEDHQMLVERIEHLPMNLR